MGPFDRETKEREDAILTLSSPMHSHVCRMYHVVDARYLRTHICAYMHVGDLTIRKKLLQIKKDLCASNRYSSSSSSWDQSACRRFEFVQRLLSLAFFQS